MHGLVRGMDARDHKGCVRMFDLQKQLKNLPDAPGVYLMHDQEDTVIYVGKAKILKNRVRQYFQSQRNHTAKVQAMVRHIAWFETIVTDSELEALVLECNLIKKYRPHYNILLKDDKHYPYIKVTMNEPYPKLVVTRTMEHDKARYFGPYTGMSDVRNTLDVLRRIFQIPTCKRKFPNDIGKGRPCLNYQIGQCFAPCRGSVTQEEYRKVFGEICKFLEGRQDELIDELKQKMQQAASQQEFEQAASYRDKAASIEAISQRQKIVSDKMSNQDICAFLCYDNKAFAEMFFVRSGRVIGRQSYRMDNVAEMSDTQIMTEFLKRYYAAAVSIPNEIILQHEVEEKEILTSWLSERLGKKVHLITPKRGEKSELIKMVEKNAQRSIDDYKLVQLKRKSGQGALDNLARYLGLDASPHRMESYDISNTAGSCNVGAMVVFTDAQPDRGAYRHFRIKSVSGQDDYASMAEMIRRRILHARKECEQIEAGEMQEKQARFLPMPDLILLDGGKGHVNAIQRVLRELDEPIPLFGMVKDDRHHFRAITDGERELQIPKNSSAYSLIGKLSEQVHKTAIAYHNKLRGKKGMASELSEISGIGETRRKLLMKKFLSIDAIASASIDELRQAGLDKKSAANVHAYFNGE